MCAKDCTTLCIPLSKHCCLLYQPTTVLGRALWFRLWCLVLSSECTPSLIPAGTGETQLKR